MSINAYPLCWPANWPRTPGDARKYGRFSRKARSNTWSWQQDITIADAVGRIQAELRAFDGPGGSWSRIDPDQTIISTNLKVKTDGLPYASQKAPLDPGAVLYFELDGKRKHVPCDTYTKVEQNLAGIAATLSALRTLERHGSGLMEGALAGFTALPPPITGSRPWRDVLQTGDGLSVSREVMLERAERHFKILASSAHPDHGGSPDEMQRLLKARDEARKELS